MCVYNKLFAITCVYCSLFSETQKSNKHCCTLSCTIELESYEQSIRLMKYTYCKMILLKITVIQFKKNGLTILLQFYGSYKLICTVKEEEELFEVFYNVYFVLKN